MLSSPALSWLLAWRCPMWGPYLCSFLCLHPPLKALHMQSARFFASTPAEAVQKVTPGSVPDVPCYVADICTLTDDVFPDPTPQLPETPPPLKCTLTTLCDTHGTEGRMGPALLLPKMPHHAVAASSGCLLRRTGCALARASQHIIARVLVYLDLAGPSHTYVGFTLNSPCHS